MVSSVPTISTPAGGVQRFPTIGKYLRHKHDEFEMIHHLKTKENLDDGEKEWLKNHKSAVQKYEASELEKVHRIKTNDTLSEDDEKWLQKYKSAVEK